MRHQNTSQNELKYSNACTFIFNLIKRRTTIMKPKEMSQAMQKTFWD